jgi:hypothetical protein
MSEEKARRILRETAGPFSKQSVRTQLPNNERLGRRVTDRNAHDALLRFAIEHTVREAVWRAEMFSTDAEHGLAAELVRYVPTPCGSCNPDRVQMTVACTYANRLREPIIAVVTHDAQGHVVVDIALGGAQVQPQNALLAHVDGFEQPGPGGVVIGVVLSPNFIFRTYPSSAGAQRAPARGANPQRGPLPRGFIDRTYPSSGPAPVQSRPGGHH